METIFPLTQPIMFKIQSLFRAHLSREELARQLGISVSYLGKIERSTQVREKMLARVKCVLSESNR